MNNPTLIYVGGHCGHGLERAIAEWNPLASFVFEPNPELAATLASRGLGAEVIEAAAGTFSGNVRLNIYGEDGGSSSVFTVNPDAAEAFRSFGNNTFDGEAKALTVGMVNLLTFVEERAPDGPLVFVFDCQGMDLQLAKHISKLSPRIVSITGEVDRDGLPHYNGPDNSESGWGVEMARWGFVRVWTRHDWSDPSELQNDCEWRKA